MQAAGELVGALAEAVADGEVIMTEVIGDEVIGRVHMITVEQESTEATAQPEGDVAAQTYE